MHQTKAQYNRLNRILAKILSSPLCPNVLINDCIKAIENFQCFMTKKEQYLASPICRNMSMSFDAMTTSPVESMNSSIKNGMGVTSNSNTRWTGRWLRIKHEFINYMNSCTTVSKLIDFLPSGGNYPRVITPAFFVVPEATQGYVNLTVFSSRGHDIVPTIIHLLRVGRRNLYSSCAVVSVFCSGGK